MESGGLLRVSLIVGLLALWLFYRWSRRSITAGTWALIVVIGANLVSSLIRSGARPGGLWAGLDPRAITLVANLAIVVSLLGLVLFRLYIEGYTDAAAIWSRLQRPLVVAGLASVAFVLCTIAALVTGDPMDMTNRPDITLLAGLFAMVGRAYMAWVFGQTGVWALRWLRRTTLLTWIGLALVAAGSLILAVATLIDSAAALFSLLGFTVPDTHGFISASDTLGAIGIVGGIVLPVIAGRFHAGAVWTRSWWLHRRLGPLWESVRSLYPELVLTVSHQTGLGSAQLRRFLLRRRMTECADGLARLTADPPETGPGANLAQLASSHYPALADSTPGPRDVDTLTSVISSDVHRLVRLSSAIAKHSNPGA